MAEAGSPVWRKRTSACEIFQRGTDVIDVIAVHYQETIVASPIGADVDGRILVVVTDEVEP